MKLYKFSMLLITLIIVAVVLVTTLQIMQGNGMFKGSEEFANNSISVLYQYVIAILLGSYCVIQIACLLTRKFSVQNLGFFILHTGIVLFLIGVFIYSMVGVTSNQSIPVDSSLYSEIGISEISDNKGGYPDAPVRYIDLGFQIGASDFIVEKYDPIYDLYKKDKSGEYKQVVHDVTPDSKGNLDFGEYGNINENVFVGSETQYPLNDNKDLIAVKRQPDKYYEANLIIKDLTGSEKNIKLITNKPFRKNGWIVYLMSYSPDLSRINVLFKYDPAEIISQLGIWMLIIGTFIMCFYRKKKQGGKVNG